VLSTDLTDGALRPQRRLLPRCWGLSFSGTSSNVWNWASVRREDHQAHGTVWHYAPVLDWNLTASAHPSFPKPPSAEAAFLMHLERNGRVTAICMLVLLVVAIVWQIFR
jgi:hypothetical protein